MKDKTKKFIENAKLKHYDKFNYDKTEYKGCRKKLIITCPKHGDFEQTPDNHLTFNTGCKECILIERSFSKNNFIEKANLIHKNKFNYYKCNYINNYTKIIITCSIHGDFEQLPSGHLAGMGCIKCRNEKATKTTEQFIEDANKIHNNLYDYSKVEYINTNEKIKIICIKHGEFTQKAANHLLGKGCKKCQINNQTKTTEKFVEEANLTHNNYYDYSKSIYKKRDELIIIICPNHGEFNQTPLKHLTTKGCMICYNKTKTTEKFIEEANLVHNYLYDYSKTYYINCKEKVIITCKKHGEFEQIPLNHLKMVGCPNCSNSKGALKIKNILDINNIEYIQEMKFNDCRNKNPLPFDFYLPEYKTCIEFDGRQHFESIEHWEGDNGLLKIKKNDSIKNEYCKDNDIKLIRIPYYEIDNIEDKLFCIFNI